MAQRGTFITFEGGEGSGKSTVLKQVEGRLHAMGRTVLVAREPGGTDVGEQIRHVLQYNKKSVGIVAEAELLLFCASRAQLVREVIEPALAAGQVVICDRFHDSTTVYQGVGRLLDPVMVGKINGFAIGRCVPDLTVVIDLDPRIGLERARGRELFDRMENQSLEFYHRVRAGYLDLAKREPKRVKVVNGEQSLTALEREVWELVHHVVE